MRLHNNGGYSKAERTDRRSSNALFNLTYKKWLPCIIGVRDVFIFKYICVRPSLVLCVVKAPIVVFLAVSNIRLSVPGCKQCLPAALIAEGSDWGQDCVKQVGIQKQHFSSKQSVPPTLCKTWWEIGCNTLLIITEILAFQFWCHRRLQYADETSNQSHGLFTSSWPITVHSFTLYSKVNNFICIH